MKLGSLFDGSGTAPLAASMCGIEPVWASEIEPYPIRVTTARFPHMKHLGDITQIDGAEVEPVDVICGGSPCQDLSVAGKQAGIHAGERSHLFFEMTRIIKEMRESTNGKYPKYIIWENVPGAFSSNNGNDFLAVLQSFAEIAEDDVLIPRPATRGKTERLAWTNSGEVVGDGWSIAWRTVDAQFWGVPQRRRRIYLVADLGSERAGEVLFERKGVCGDSSEGGASWEGTADNAAGSAGGSDCAGFCGKAAASAGSIAYKEECSATLKAGMQMHVVYTNTGRGWWNESEVCETLRTPCGGDAMKANLCVYPNTARCLEARHDSSPCVDRGQNFCVYALQGNGIDRADTAGCNGCGWRENECYTLNTIDRPAVCYEGQNCLTDDKTAYTLQAGRPDDHHIPSVVYDCRGNGDGKTAANLTGDHENRVTDYTNVVCAGNGQMNNITMKPVANTMDNMHDQQIVLYKASRKYIVRRFTPLECCRLQGFPDFWADGVEGSDSAKYKMWGNGMALPNMLHVMRGIARE